MYLQVKQLNKSYGSRRVVSNVDFLMEEGEILSLLGPSGCGKTTILRSIAGLVTPESGLIKIGGRVLFDGKRGVPVEERQLGMVFQDYALWPHMTVARHIAFGMRLRRSPSRVIEARIQELLVRLTSPAWLIAIPINSPVGNSSVLRSRVRLLQNPECFCSMSHFPAWILLCARPCARSLCRFLNGLRSLQSM